MTLSKSRMLSNSLLNYVRGQSFAPTFCNMAASARANLPNLPVPKLRHTLDKYLRSVTPFLSQSELAETAQVLSQFESGIGAKLQQLLEERTRDYDNWLANWWLNVAYLEYRDPVVVYSSPGLMFPFQNFQNQGDLLNYAAKLIMGALAYKNLIDHAKIPVDKMGKDLLDMNQYNKIFGTCRIPGLKNDSLEFNPQSKHIVIVKNNHFFKLEVYNAEGKFPSLGEVLSSLQDIFEQSEEPAPGIGVLTSENRNIWGKVYQDLIADAANLRAVREIQTSLFLVCLDNPMPNRHGNIRTQASKQLIHGGGSNGNSANRWFDKTVQFVIGADGKVGLTYEHSPSEGQPIAVMTDYIVDYIESDKSVNLPDVRFYGSPEKLSFNIDERLEKAIHCANINIDKLVNNLDTDCFQFDSYGKEFVKSQKLSPDSFIQMAIQYAFYRLHKVPGAHYESAATRKYIHGRTETIRSCSVESIDFAKTMLDPSKNDQDRAASLRKAIESHKKYSVDAVNGLGVDRHLLGLKLTAVENGIEVPELYKHVSFTRSTHMRLSTSQVATKCDGFMCYGPLVPDGYGCCYNPRPNDINFAISAFVEHPETSATDFRQALDDSLRDMHTVLSKTQQAKL